MLSYKPLVLSALLLAGARADIMRFCNEVNLGGPCVDLPLNPDQKVCQLIPDSNAKGDKGSSYEKFGIDTRYCVLYASEDCSGVTDVYAPKHKTNPAIKINGAGSLTQDWTARSINCYPNISSQCLATPGAPGC